MLTLSIHRHLREIGLILHLWVGRNILNPLQLSPYLWMSDCQPFHSHILASNLQLTPKSSLFWGLWAFWVPFHCRLSLGNSKMCSPWWEPGRCILPPADGPVILTPLKLGAWEAIISVSLYLSCVAAQKPLYSFALALGIQVGLYHTIKQGMSYT